MKPSPGVAMQVGLGHPDVFEEHLAVAFAVVVAVDLEVTDHRHAGSVARDQHHRLLAVRGGRRVGLAHQDEDGAALAAGTRGPPLAAVDDVIAAVTLDPRADVGRVRARDVRLGHREGRPDSPVQQRGQPALLLLGGAEQVQHFHVAGVGRGAVDRLGSEFHAAPGQLGQRRVVQHRERMPLPGQEEVPQPALARLRLELVQDRWIGVAAARLGAQPRLVHRLGGVDRVVHERLQTAQVILGGAAEGEVHGRNLLLPAVLGSSDQRASTVGSRGLS